MKRIRLFIPIIACAAVLLTSCKKEDGKLPDIYTIAVTNDGNGTAEADVTTAEAGTTVTLTATANSGYAFDKWTVESGGIIFTDATANPATFTMPAGNVSVKAEFVALPPETYTIAVTDDGNGTGTATVDGTAAAKAEAGKTVTLTATANGGCIFKQWSVESGTITLLPNVGTNPATFTMPAGAVSVKAEFIEQFVVINGVKWAQSNVEAPGTFAANPEDAGMFYQWNRKIGWSSADPLINSDGGTTWDSTTPTGDSWLPSNDPCPAGWRMPTEDEQVTLFDETKVSHEWVTAPTKGRKFTDKASGTTIFLPAAGERDDGKLYYIGDYGSYWSSHLKFSSYAYNLTFGSDSAEQGYGKCTRGFSVRCVFQ